VWPEIVHETGVSPSGQCGFPIMATEAEQVERNRRKTWSRARSEFCALRLPRRDARGEKVRASQGPVGLGLDRDDRYGCRFSVVMPH
jgi:hypothetical protein